MALLLFRLTAWLVYDLAEHFAVSSLFQPLRKTWAKTGCDSAAADNWMASHPAQNITFFDVPVAFLQREIMHHHRLLTCLIQSICYCLHQVYACCCLHQLYACCGLHNTCCCLSVVVVLVVAAQGSPMGMLPQIKRPFTLGMMQNAYLLKKPHSILNLVLKKYEENLHHLCSKSMKKICHCFFSLFSQLAYLNIYKQLK